MEKVVSTGKAVVIKREGHPDVALLAADELSSLMETAHLLSSENNARRLLAALERAREGKGERMSLAELSAAVGVNGTDSGS
jgi:antitoxin YefM